MHALSQVRLLGRLKRNLARSADEVRALQSRKLRALLEHAYVNVPYYRALFRSAGVSPAEIAGPEDLGRLPTTPKLKLQEQPRDDIRARNIDGRTCRSDITSGSTGIPLRVYFTEHDYIVRSLVFIRTFMRAGYKLTDKQAVVCDTRFASNRQYWFQRLGVFRKKYIPVQDDVSAQVSELVKYRPDFIHGYPLSLWAIADEMLDKGMELTSVRRVCAGAELLTAKMRGVIGKAFGVDVLDTYASVESGLIAWECPNHEGYHISADSVVLEVMKDGRPAEPGERGQAVVTNLHSFAMPIIRYELGDLCVLAPRACSCGCSFPLLVSIEGRADDMVCSPSGRMVSPNSITNAMEAVEGVRRFRVVQERVDLLVVEIVPGTGFSPRTPLEAQRLLGELTGDGIVVEARVVDIIPRDKSGKIRAVVSEVPAELRHRVSR